MSDAVATPPVVTLAPANPPAPPAKGDPPADDNEKSKSTLVAEKIHYRQRAQEAEAQRDALKTQIEGLTKERDTFKGENDGYKFRATREDKLKELIGKLPEDKAVTNMDNLVKYAHAKATNPETLEADLQGVLNDFIGPKDTGNISPTPFKGKETVGDLKDVDISKMDAFSMMKLKKENPAAFTELMSQPKRPPDKK